MLAALMVSVPAGVGSAGRFDDRGDGTVLDTKTNLMWLKDAAMAEVPAQVANSVVHEMNIKQRENHGYSDWRIPSVDEMLSIVDATEVYPALPEGNPFSGVRSSGYWTSTGGFNMAGYAWVVDLANGATSFKLTSYCNFYGIWPVRSAGSVMLGRFAPEGRPVSPGDVAFLSMPGGVCRGDAVIAPLESPSTVTATAVSPSEIVIAWEKNPDPPAWYNVYGDDGSQESAVGTNIRISGLEPETGRCFSVSAYMSTGLESARSDEVCAITWGMRAKGTVWAFGLNSFGQLGDGSRNNSSKFAQALDIDGVISVAAGVEHAAAVGEDGSLWIWGRNSRGQLGDGSTRNNPGPARIKALKGVRRAALGWYHSLALMEDGSVKAWGRNYYGQIGDGNREDSALPVDVKAMRNVVKIATGWYHSMAVRQDGTVWAWGWDLKGQLGNGEDNNSPVPAEVVGLDNIKDISGGMYHSLALASDGTVWAWGSNEFGQLGIVDYTEMHFPIKLEGLQNITALASGMYFSLALASDGTVWAWGRNDYGQLGRDDITNSYAPLQVPVLKGIKSIAAGAHHAVAVDSDGALWLWGWDFADGVKFSPPHRVGGLRGITGVAAGIHFTTVLKGK